MSRAAAATNNPDNRRVDERDADYQRLYTQTTARLQRSVQQYAQELQRNLPGASTRFVHRHRALMQQAYEAAHKEGQKDYWPEVSARAAAPSYVAPNEPLLRRRMNYYALGSVLNMAREIESYVRNAQRPASSLSDGPTSDSTVLRLMNTNHDSHGRFAAGGSGTKAGGAANGRGAGSAEHNNGTSEHIGDVNGASKGLFGRQLSESELRGLVGAQPGMHVVISGDGESQLYFTVEGKLPDGGHYIATRYLTRGDDGKLAMQNVESEMSKSSQGKGYGTKIFADQVQAASRAGVDHIELDAARGGKYNGYYTWVRMGADARLSARQQSFIRTGEPAFWHTWAPPPSGVAAATRLSDIMKAPGGAAWWKAYGWPVDVQFDLHAGSPSMRGLALYLADKKGK